jgi:putative ABC transport system ATP-binding protein
VMVTHDPRAAAIADRILYLLDGRIVLDRRGESEAEILRTMNELDSFVTA